MFKFSSRSLSRLNGVHPLLIGVVVRALSVSEVDFGVVEGVRTIERQLHLVAEGRSKTLNSKHLINEKTGFCHAVDIYPSGFSSVSDIPDTAWLSVRDAMMRAADEVLPDGVTIEWGGDWKSFVDKPHYQIVGV